MGLARTANWGNGCDWLETGSKEVLSSRGCLGVVDPDAGLGDVGSVVCLKKIDITYDDEDRINETLVYNFPK